MSSLRFLYLYIPWAAPSLGLTRGAGDGGAALVLRLLHHAVLAYGLDEGADSKYVGVKLCVLVEVVIT